MVGECSQLPDDGEFDPYSLADEQRQQESAARDNELFLLKLRNKLGDKPDADLLKTAAVNLRESGAEMTPETLAEEYGRLEGKMRNRFVTEHENKRLRSTGYTPSFGGVTRPQPTRLEAEQKGLDIARAQKVESFVETIKKDQKRRGIYAY
jgi:hypothetical protein